MFRAKHTVLANSVAGTATSLSTQEPETVSPDSARPTWPGKQQNGSPNEYIDQVVFAQAGTAVT